MKKISTGGWLIIGVVFIAIVITIGHQYRNEYDSRARHSQSTAADSIDFAAAATVDAIDRGIDEKKEESDRRNAFLREQSLIVYGKLKFRDSRKTYNKYLPDSDRKIGRFDYFFSPSFNKRGELYRLSIEGYSKTANYIDNAVRDEMKNLIDVITAKYGAPDETFPYPKIFDFKPGYIKWVNSWNVFTKRISIGVAEESEGSKYYAVCWIYDTNMYEQVQNSGQSDADARKKSEAEKF